MKKCLFFIILVLSIMSCSSSLNTSFSSKTGLYSGFGSTVLVSLSDIKIVYDVYPYAAEYRILLDSDVLETTASKFTFHNVSGTVNNSSWNGTIELEFSEGLLDDEIDLNVTIEDGSDPVSFEVTK